MQAMAVFLRNCIFFPTKEMITFFSACGKRSVCTIFPSKHGFFCKDEPEMQGARFPWTHSSLFPASLSDERRQGAGWTCIYPGRKNGLGLCQGAPCWCLVGSGLESICWLDREDCNWVSCSELLGVFSLWGNLGRDAELSEEAAGWL